MAGLTDCPQQWEIWETWWAHSARPGDGKTRPVIIGRMIDPDCVAIYVTSQIGKHQRSADYVLLSEWEKAGLDKPSATRVRSMRRIPISALKRRIGMLEAKDITDIQLAMMRIGRLG